MPTRGWISRATRKLVANNYTSGQQADTAKAQVAQLEALVKQDQAQIDNARTLLGYTTITSPLDGRTGMRQVDAGNIVHASDTTGMVVITQLQPISVVFTLPQQTLAQVSRAMSQGAAKVLAYAQGAIGSQTGVLDTGTLTVLDNQVDPTTGTIKLKATFPNPEQSAVAGRIRRRAGAGGHREERDRGAAGRGAARAAQHVCVCGRTRTTRRRGATSRSATRTRRRRSSPRG